MSELDRLPVRRQVLKTTLVLLTVALVIAVVGASIWWAGIALPRWATVWNPGR
jgi:hypothetical protein